MLNHIRAATDLLEIVDDPLIRDAIRVLTTPSSPAPVVETARNYVESQYSNYLKLFANSDRELNHGYFRQPADSDVD